MHVATQLKAENLHITIQQRDADLEALFPQGHRYDRYGFLITQPYGSFGASLLIQAAIVHFYDLNPARRDTEPMYPEIYMFHIGGAFGDHSSFDFWPPRKEIFLDAGRPAELLATIVDRGITRLAVPAGTPTDPEVLRDGVNTFADLGSAQNLLSSCFVYSPSGKTNDADVVLSSDHDSFEANIARTLEREQILDQYFAAPESLSRAGPSVATDLAHWIDAVVVRKDEVDREPIRRAATQRRHQVGQRLVRTESFRRISVDEMFGFLAAL
ncbi:MAG TPA: hypothetical protein VIG71_07030 [Enteractinococcus sp.]